MLIDSVPDGNGRPARTGALPCTPWHSRSAMRRISGSDRFDHTHRKLVAAVAAGHGVTGKLRGEHMPNVADRFGAREVPVGIVERLQAIEVQHQHPDRCPRRSHRTHHRGQLPFEGAKVVQASEVVGHGHRVQAAAVLCQSRGDEAHRDEEGNLDEVGLAIREGQKRGVGEVIEHDRAERGQQAAEPLQPQRGEDDRRVIEMLDRRRISGSVQQEGDRQARGERDDRPGRRLRPTTGDAARSGRRRRGQAHRGGTLPISTRLMLVLFRARRRPRASTPFRCALLLC